MKKQAKNRLRLSCLLSICLLAGVFCGAIPVSAMAAAQGVWTDAGNFDVNWYDDAQTTLAIEDEADFAAFIAALEQGEQFGGKTVALMADLDLSAHTFAGRGQAEDASFLGTFDGRGHTVRHYRAATVRSGDASYSIFGNLCGATVRDVTFADCTVAPTSLANAGLNGRAVTVSLLTSQALKATIENVQIVNGSVTVPVSGGMGPVVIIMGGLIGLNFDETTVKNCTVDVDFDYQGVPFWGNYVYIAPISACGADVSASSIALAPSVQPWEDTNVTMHSMTKANARATVDSSLTVQNCTVQSNVTTHEDGNSSVDMNIGGVMAYSGQTSRTTITSSTINLQVNCGAADGYGQYFIGGIMGYSDAPGQASSAAPRGAYYHTLGLETDAASGNTVYLDVRMQGAGYADNLPQGQWLCLGGLMGYEHGNGSAFAYNHVESNIDLSQSSGLQAYPYIGGLVGYMRATLYRGFSNFTALSVSGSEAAQYSIGNAYGFINDSAFYGVNAYRNPHSAMQERSSQYWKINDDGIYCYTLVNGTQLLKDANGFLIYAGNRNVYYKDTSARDIYFIVPQTIQAGVAAEPFVFEAMVRRNGQNNMAWPLDPQSNATAGLNEAYRYSDGDTEDGVLVTGSTAQATVMVDKAAPAVSIRADLGANTNDYAIWFHLPVSVTAPVTYQVMFESNGGSAVETQTVVANQRAEEPAVPNKPGHTFAGWYRDEALQQPWDFTQDTVTGNITLYAKWTMDSYQVTFESNGGTDVEGQTVPYGGLVAEPPTPVREGYTFLGWYLDVEWNRQWAFTDDTVTQDITLYARWKIHTEEPLPMPSDDQAPPVLPTPPSDIPQTGETRPHIWLWLLGALLFTTAAWLIWPACRNKEMNH